MSLTGKVFAFLNLLGVAAILVLGLMTYTKKMAWANANAQQVLRLEGVPVSDLELDKHGYNKKDNLTETNIKAVVPGRVVWTQVDEVKAVHTTFEQKLEAEDSTPKKLVFLADAVRRFTTEFPRYRDLMIVKQRMADDKSQANLKTQLSRAVKQAEELIKAQAAPNPMNPRQAPRTFAVALEEFAAVSWADPRNDPFVRAYRQAHAAAVLANKPTDFEALYTAALDFLLEEAKGEYAALHQAALAGTVGPLGTPEQKQLSVAVQRGLIARYLYVMAPTVEPEGMKNENKEFAPPAIQRVLGIVGLEAFPAAVEEQALRTGWLTRSAAGTKSVTTTAEIIRQIEADRGQFVAEHNRMITYLKELDSIVKERETRLVRVTKLLEDQKNLAADSEAINALLNGTLTRLRTDVSQELKVIRELSQSLLEVRLQTRDAAEVNQKLEQEIRRLERLYR